VQLASSEKIYLEASLSRSSHINSFLSLSKGIFIHFSSHFLVFREREREGIFRERNTKQGCLKWIFTRFVGKSWSLP